MEYRELGRTGFKASIIGFGGMVAARMAQEEVSRVVSWAIDHGVNYFDSAPTYWDAEELLGPALKGRRDDVFLACKTTERDRAGASKELHESLERLQTDHFDLYQLHGVRSMDELDRALGPGGAIETLIDAKERGLTRFIGITTHWTDVALSALSRFDFDTILFPINFVCWYKANVGPDVLEAAARKDMGRMAMKSLARGPWPQDAERIWKNCWYQPIDDPALAELAARFTLSQDVNVLIPPGEVELFRMTVDAADRFHPLQADEAERLRSIASGMEPIFHRTA